MTDEALEAGLLLLGFEPWPAVAGQAWFYPDTYRWMVRVTKASSPTPPYREQFYYSIMQIGEHPTKSFTDPAELWQEVINLTKVGDNDLT